jgi:predicted AAA+ superfamily ATPase
MERAAMADLVAWKNGSRRKPLLLFGARQVGKTWLLREFGRRHYARTVYLSLDQSVIARGLFEGDLNVKRLVSDFAIAAGGGAIDPADTLIVLDEVQEAPRALAALKYFAEDAPEYHIACAGSLLGVAAHAGTSFPVGKVNLIDIRPATFIEFLGALGEEALAVVLQARDFARLEPFHDRLVRHLRSYLFVGGMPEAVVAYAESRDPVVVRAIQRDLLGAYDRDFSKHAPTAEVPRLRALFDAVSTQLARENRRFVHSQVQPGARAKTFELALQWLADAGLLHVVHRVTAPRLPLPADTDFRAFKLFLVDVGLVGAMVGLDAVSLIDGNALFTEFKGALAEQYALQELVAADLKPFYWSNGPGAAEVDFVVQPSGLVVPLEIKASINRNAKSLRVYRDRFDPPVSIRASLRPYRDEGWLVNLPLYALGQLPSLITDRLAQLPPAT